MSGERITDDERAYHTAVLEAYKDAQRRMVVAEAAFQSWAQFLHRKYELDVERGEQVTEQGEIVR